MVHRREAMSNLIYALDHLPELLKYAEDNDELITFARRHIFPQQAFRFPRLQKRAQNAVNSYLVRFPANPPATPRPECFGEGSDEPWGKNPGGTWNKIFILFLHFLAFLVYICFLWVTCFA
jgi:hypothetical protein